MSLFSRRADQTKTAPETIYGEIQCAPLVDVLSISIGSCLDNVGKSTLCEIYGKIRVLDTQRGYEDELFSFFDKDEDNPEYVHFDEPLLLTTLLPTPVFGPSQDICLDVCLFDRRANNMVVASGKIILDKKGDGCEEIYDVKIGSLQDERIFARVHYTIIQYAAAATIEVLFFSKEDKFDLFSNDASATNIRESLDTIDLVDYDQVNCGDGVATNVFGTVRGHNNLKAANGNVNHPIFLFKKPHSQGVQVKSGGFIQLSRSAVILPAYSSSLVIEVDLFHSEGDIQTPIASNNLEFQLHSQGSFKKDLVGKHGERIRVRVTWNQLYVEEADDAMPERPEFPISRKGGLIHWLEMSSVVFHRKDFKPFSCYGTISVIELFTRTWIFSKDKNHPQIYHESGALITSKDAYFPSVKVQGRYLVIVDLRDAETGETVSLGSMQWDQIVIKSWLDKRLCSVVRGEEGFAALHYTTFYDGICARLDMKLCGKHLPGYVYGKIVARYTTYDYSTAYDKKYYQITLFDNEDDGSQHAAQTCGSSLPLLKPFVCLARGSSLIVEANLRVSSKRPFDAESPQGTKFLQDTVELNSYSGSRERLGCEPCFIDVHVDWHYDDLPIIKGFDTS